MIWLIVIIMGKNNKIISNIYYIIIIPTIPSECPWSSKTQIQISSISIVSWTQILMVREQFPMLLTLSRVLAVVLATWFVKYFVSILASDLANLQKNNVMPLLIWSMILKDMVSPSGSLIEIKIIKKEKICKWLTIFCKLN